MDDELAAAGHDPPAVPSVQIVPSARRGFSDHLRHEFMELRDLAARLSDRAIGHETLDEVERRLRRLDEAAGPSGLPNLRRKARFLGRRVRQLRSQTVSFHDSLAQPAAHHETASLINTLCEFATDSLRQASTDESSGWADAVRVWLIADQASKARDHARQLEGLGYLTDWFPTAAEAMRVACVAPPDVFILYAGGKLADNDAQGWPHGEFALSGWGAPVIIVAPADHVSERIQATRLGAEIFAPEPLDVHRLANRIDKLLERRQELPEKVLVIEPVGPSRQHSSKILHEAGMQVETHGQPDTIMERLAVVRPELVLMDHCLANPSSLDLAATLCHHERWSNLPIVHLLPPQALDRLLASPQYQGFDFLLKPVPDIQLIAGLRARIRRQRDLNDMASRDSLTGLLNHASIKVAADIELARARRTGRTITLAIIDIDRFKSVNDLHGHATGDKVIEGLALLLRHRLRRSDLVGRYGGEEFLIVLLDCDAASGWSVLDSLRSRFQATDFGAPGNSLTCSFSAGLACSTDFADCNLLDILVIADEALYAAKRAGRNRAIVAEAAIPLKGGEA